jgi:hypothetical protein
MKTLQERIVEEVRACSDVKELQAVARILTKEIAQYNLKMSIQCENTYDFARNNRYSVQLNNLFNHEVTAMFVGFTL